MKLCILHTDMGDNIYSYREDKVPKEDHYTLFTKENKKDILERYSKEDLVNLLIKAQFDMCYDKK